MADRDDGDQGKPTVAVREPKDVPCDTVGNPADPDTSFNTHKGHGYLAQIVETYREDDGDEKIEKSPDLITYVAVHRMTVHDAHHPPGALADLAERSLAPKVMLADFYYGCDDNMSMTKGRDIDLIAPARPTKGTRSGRITLEDFVLNDQGLVVRCPNDIVPASVLAAKVRLQARFDLSICRECPHLQQCPMQAVKHDGEVARFQYTHKRAAYRKCRLYEKSNISRDIYRWRASIEATMSRLKYQMNMADLRVRGMSAMRYVVHLRALGLNIRRCATVCP